MVTVASVSGFPEAVTTPLSTAGPAAGGDEAGGDEVEDVADTVDVDELAELVEHPGTRASSRPAVAIVMATGHPPSPRCRTTA
jgi:hypothetical protein